MVGQEGRGDGRGYRWEAVLTEQEEKLKGEVSILDLCSSVTSWGHVTRAPPSGEEPKLFGLFFSLFAFRERQARVNTVSTQLLVCACSLRWVRLHGNHRKQKWWKCFCFKKKENENNKYSKGLQLNTHIRRIHFGDIYNHAVRKERKRWRAPLLWAEMIYISVIIFIQISLCYRSCLGDSSSPRVHPSLPRRLQFLVFCLSSRHPSAWSMLRAFHLPDEGSPVMERRPEKHLFPEKKKEGEFHPKKTKSEDVFWSSFPVCWHELKAHCPALTHKKPSQ